MNVDFFFGNDENVLKDIMIVKKFNIKNEDNIIRITADCPFTDPKLLDKLLQTLKDKKLEVVSNTQPASFPDGMDICVLKFYLLKKAYFNAKNKYDLEHVTPFVYRIKNIRKENIQDKKDFSRVRLTLDNLSDLNFLNFIFNELNQDIGFTYKKLKNLLIKLRKIIMNLKNIFIQMTEILEVKCPQDIKNGNMQKR